MLTNDVVFTIARINRLREKRKKRDKNAPSCVSRTKISSSLTHERHREASLKIGKFARRVHVLKPVENIFNDLSRVFP